MFNISFEGNSVARFTKALGQIDKRTRYWKNELPRLYMLEYYRAVLQAIESERYAAYYAPLSDKYKKWKENHAEDTKFWVKTGATRSALATMTPVSTKESDDYIEYMMNLPDSLWYISLIEQGFRGSGKGGAPLTIPARPVFGPTFDVVQARFESYTKRALADLNTVWEG
jgi:hypothetical protein